jgi:zinc transporter, ZIP family
MGMKNPDMKMVKPKPSTDYVGLIALLGVILITIFTCPHEWNHTTVSLSHVWFYGWITAISTGLGALPFLFLSEPSKYLMGISNGKNIVMKIE